MNTPSGTVFPHLYALLSADSFTKKVIKKLKPEKFFMGKPSQNYGVPLKYGAHNFTCSLT